MFEVSPILDVADLQRRPIAALCIVCSALMVGGATSKEPPKVSVSKVTLYHPRCHTIAATRH